MNITQLFLKYNLDCTCYLDLRNNNLEKTNDVLVARNFSHAYVHK